MTNIPNAKDASPLWSGFNEPNYENSKYNGVHGNPWTPKEGNTQGNNGFTKIASPVPKAPAAKPVDRIIANDLPAKTTSASSFDLPARKNVIQINLPNSVTKTSELSYNAFKTPASSFNNLRATLHGINTVGKRELHGRFMEIEKPEKSVVDMNQLKNASQTALKQAKKIEAAAAKLAATINPKPKGYVMGITTVNKKEKLRMH
jgi:hypothetical protein